MESTGTAIASYRRFSPAEVVHASHTGNACALEVDSTFASASRLKGFVARQCFATSRFPPRTNGYDTGS